jgi:hypothetical protein
VAGGADRRIHAGNDEPVNTKLDRCAVVGAILFGALGVLGALLLRHPLGVCVLPIGFVLQWLCKAVYFAQAGWQTWRAYRRQHDIFARDLDQQRVKYDVLVDAVRRYPLPVITTCLHFIRDRKSTIAYRAGRVSGGLDKMGVLPLWLAMYLPFKDWSFEGWRELLGHVHLLGNFLLSMLRVTYLISWWGVRAKGCLDLYERVLTEALVRRDEVF